jgi:hypothetical protein
MNGTEIDTMTEIDAPAPEPSEEQRRAAEYIVADIDADWSWDSRCHEDRGRRDAEDAIARALADVAEATRRECAEVAQEAIGENVRKTAALDAENTILRGMAARLMPCHYCKVDDIAECPSGFPGCALADDLIVADDLAFKNMKDRAMKAEATVERLQEDCAEAYQVVGVLLYYAGKFDTIDGTKALDNLQAASDGTPRPHADLLPFPSERWADTAAAEITSPAPEDTP